MKQFINLFFPSVGSFKNSFNEVAKTSNSRIRFIDFLKVAGLLLVVFNTYFF